MSKNLLRSYYGRASLLRIKFDIALSKAFVRASLTKAMHSKVRDVSMLHGLRITVDDDDLPVNEEAYELQKELLILIESLRRHTRLTDGEKYEGLTTMKAIADGAINLIDEGDLIERPIDG